MTDPVSLNVATLRLLPMLLVPKGAYRQFRVPFFRLLLVLDALLWLVLQLLACIFELREFLFAVEVVEARLLF